MSGYEIERKFMVKKAGSQWREQAFSATTIQQGYFDCNGATVRVRLRAPLPLNDQPVTDGNKGKGYLTIKSPSMDGGMSRYEFEREIEIEEALNLMSLCRGGVIKKTRYLVRKASHTWEVDEFHGDNEGLVFAEVELASAEEEYEKPDFIGPEVTGNRHYYNNRLLHNPYTEWCSEVPEEYR